MKHDLGGEKPTFFSLQVEGVFALWSRYICNLICRITGRTEKVGMSRCHKSLSEPVLFSFILFNYVRYAAEDLQIRKSS